MADLTPNKRPDGQSPEDGGLEKSLESLSLDELLASVKDDLARVDAMMNDKDEEEQAKTQAEAELEQETQPQKQTPNMPPLFEPATSIKKSGWFVLLPILYRWDGCRPASGCCCMCAACWPRRCCLPCLRGAARTMCCP